MTQPAPTLEETHALAVEALAKASEAAIKAKEAIDRCERAEASVAGLSHVVTRCTNEVLDTKRVVTELRTESAAAFEGVKAGLKARERADSQHDTKLRTIESKLTALDLVKITLAGGGGSFVVTLVLSVLAMLLGRPAPPPGFAPPPPAIVAPAPGATP